MIILDTNVVSETMRDAPAPPVVAWFNAQNSLDLFIPSLAIAEIAAGIARLPRGTRRERLHRALADLREGLYRGRIVAFEERAAAEYGELVARRRAEGRTLPVIDALITATALAHGATLATRNIRDFDGLGLDLVNPFDTPP